LPFKHLLQLGKPQIILPVTLSAFTGFILFRGALDGPWLSCISGIFLLSAASAVINQVQEAGTDILMDRTRHRPIPSGKISKTTAWFLAAGLAICGFPLLWFFCGLLPAGLALFTLLWYNAVYTPLKKITAFAVIPGSLVGALPPVIGWTAAGGDLWHPHILMVAFFFFVGQIPHFWLILLRYGTDYEKAGFPTLGSIFSERQVRNLTLGWTSATAMAALLLPLFGVISSTFFSAMLLLATLGLLLSFLPWFSRQQETIQTGPAFRNINAFYLLVMLLLIGDALTG
jgi:heme o synthase